MTTLEYILIGFNIWLVIIACTAMLHRKIREDVKLKIKTLEGHIATLLCIIETLGDMRDEVQRTHRLAQAIAEAVAKPKTGLAPTPVTLTPPVTAHKAARANPANVKGGRK